MCALAIAAYIVKCHLVVGLTRVSLKEYGLSIVTSRAWMFVCAWQCWIRYDVGDDLSQFVYFMGYFVHINAWIVGKLLMITIATL